jgi:hypothetical protein
MTYFFCEAFFCGALFCGALFCGMSGLSATSAR